MRKNKVKEITEKNKEEQLVFYAISLVKEPTKFLSLTLTKEEATEFVLQHLKMRNLEHFSSWCDCHELNVNDDLAWLKYFNDVLTVKDKTEYTINKIGYTYINLGAFLRMFSGCLPIGCSFDQPIEYEYVDSKMRSMDKLFNTPELKDDLLKALEEYKKIWE